MKYAFRNALRCSIFLAVLLIGLPCSAQDSAQESVGKFGTIDWIGQRVSAAGVGVPAPNAGNPAQARAMAKRAAEVLARRNLLEVVKGIRIDSSTTVVDYAVKDDRVVSHIKGVLNFSTVDEYAYLPDGSIRALVSMPFTGQLGEVLTRLNVDTAAPGERPPLPDVERRIQLLEDRVRQLETKLSSFKKINAGQEEQIALYRQFIRAWADYVRSGPYPTRIDYKSGANASRLESELAEQARQLEDMSGRLNDLAQRLALLEAGRPALHPEKRTGGGAKVTYSGLLIDARQTGFKPCLMPEIFSGGRRLYPGAYINMQEAIRNGYVRYYRKIESAQQSSRAGSFPLIVTAKGTFKGDGALEIGTKDSEALSSVIDQPENFMARCQVVIVF